MAWNIFKNRNLKREVEKKLSKIPWEIESDKIISLLKPTIGIETITFENIKVGSSKFGGLPDLPNNMEWPSLNGFPFGFIAQINLSELKFDIDDLLPKKGVLYFFFSLNNSDYSKEPYDKIHKVIYYDENFEDLSPRTYPKKYDDLAKFKGSSLAFFEHYTLPSYQNYQITELGLSDFDEELYFDCNDLICQITGANSDVGNQLLGNANAVQGDVSFWWINQDYNQISDEMALYRKNNINYEEREIILLLQVDMLDRAAGFAQFGASGGLYFGIHKADLKNHNFQKTKFVLQNS